MIVILEIRLYIQVHYQYDKTTTEIKLFDKLPLKRYAY